MFRRRDIVAVPDGRAGLVARVSAFKGTITVQFGADGPFEKFRAKDLRFTRSEELEASGGTDFYRLNYGAKSNSDALERARL